MSSSKTWPAFCQMYTQLNVSLLSSSYCMRNWPCHIVPTFKNMLPCKKNVLNSSTLEVPLIGCIVFIYYVFLTLCLGILRLGMSAKGLNPKTPIIPVMPVTLHWRKQEPMNDSMQTSSWRRPADSRTRQIGARHLLALFLVLGWMSDDAAQPTNPSVSECV